MVELGKGIPQRAKAWQTTQVVGRCVAAQLSDAQAKVAR